MADTSLNDCTAYQQLKQIFDEGYQNEFHLNRLLQQPDRFEKYTAKSDGFFFDYSKQRMSNRVVDLLMALAKERKAKTQFKHMVSGGMVNTTEKRAALHTAARNYTGHTLYVGETEICGEFEKINLSIKAFAEGVHNQSFSGSTGKPFTDAVIIGIGGSYLGCEFVYSALKVFADPVVSLHFLPNVDIDHFGQTIKKINPESTLWIVISKSYTTTETIANLNQASYFIKKSGLRPEDHLVTITAKGSPGDDPAYPALATFHMFDFIGGRFSVTSAVGGVPLSLAFGFKRFERFLDGCRRMDTHALTAPEDKNIPLLAALISIWNSHFLGYGAQAIIPYCSALSRLAPHIQQLYMESLGKSATQKGKPVDYPTGSIIFGEPGTNAQHSFFQLAHQGAAFPIDFIGVIRPVYEGRQVWSNGVSNHQELWANMLAQAKALAVGQPGNEPTRHFQGNRPSSTLLIEDLTPESIGRLLAFYEARTVFEGFILDVNPFDQFGVELGKVLATDIRKEIARKNKAAEYGFDAMDPACRFYLDALFKGTL